MTASAADSEVGAVRLDGDWFDLRFDHDIRVAHRLRGLGARRVELGHWRVPRSLATRLVHELADFSFSWHGEAAAARADVLQSEAEARQEDALALAAKAGQQPFGEWTTPVRLFPHQRPGVDFLVARSGALLCDEQGLGKTLTCLTAFWLLRQRGEAERLLVICPNSLKHNWRAETEKFFPDFRLVVVGGPKRARQRLYQTSADLYVVNYESARGDYADIRRLLRIAPTVVACDESHYAKNLTSRTTRALSFIRSAASRMWVMSGTPVPNRLNDAYAQVTLADDGRLLGSRAAFDREFAKRDDVDQAAADLRRRLDPILLRRTKDEVLDLPEKTFEQRVVELTGEQRRLYEAVRSDLLHEVTALTPAEFEKLRSNFLLKLLRLSQIASNPRLVVPDYVGPSAKTEEIDQLLEDLVVANGRKVVLWSYYVATIEELLDRYSRYNPVAIYGAVPTPERARAVERFQGDEECRLFVGNPQAAGTGLTLTAAHYAIYETLTWRFDLYAQSLDRIHRIGQDRNVTYFTVLANGTVDFDVLDNLERKRAVAATVLGDSAASPEFDQQDVVAMLERSPGR